MGGKYLIVVCCNAWLAFNGLVCVIEMHIYQKIEETRRKVIIFKIMSVMRVFYFRPSKFKKKNVEFMVTFRN